VKKEVPKNHWLPFDGCRRCFQSDNMGQRTGQWSRCWNQTGARRVDFISCCSFTKLKCDMNRIGFAINFLFAVNCP